MTSAHAQPTAPAAAAGPEVGSEERISRLLDLVSDVSRARRPQDVIHAYAKHSGKLNPQDGYISLSTRDLPDGHYRVTRFIDDGDVERLAEADPWNAPPIEPASQGFLADAIADGRPKVFNDLRVTDDPALGDRLAPFRSAAVLPLYDDGQALNWSIMLRRAPHGFTPKDLEELLLRANLVGTCVRHVRTGQQLSEAKLALAAEVEKIAQIQHALLDSNLPNIKGYSLGADYRTAASAGGDMYFFHPLGTSPLDGTGDHNGWWGIFVADVAGHGPAAAVVMAMVQSILSAFPERTTDGPANVLAYLNQHLCAKGIEGAFVTAFCAELKPAEGRLTYARAGHPPPIVRSRAAAGSPTRQLDQVGGLPLGILDSAEYDCTETRLEPGDALLMFTDGLTEARDPAGNFFGEARLADALSQCASSTAQDVVASIHDAIHAHIAGCPRDDDQTLVAVVREPAPPQTPEPKP
ncbi:MAG: GAF domain-containing SpoIIE family protein phosphatase [Planctomycetota bacterium]